PWPKPAPELSVPVLGFLLSSLTVDVREAADTGAYGLRTQHAAGRAVARARRLRHRPGEQRPADRRRAIDDPRRQDDGVGRAAVHRGRGAAGGVVAVLRAA